MNSNQWKNYKLEEIAEIIGGGTPSTTDPDFWGEEIPWITPRDLASTDERFISRGERCITKKGLQNSSARLLPAGTVLLTTRAPIGYLRIALNPICTNQGFKSLIPKAEIADNQFLFYLLKNNVEYLKSVGVAIDLHFVRRSPQLMHNSPGAIGRELTSNLINRIFYGTLIGLHWRIVIAAARQIEQFTACLDRIAFPVEQPAHQFSLPFRLEFKYLDTFFAISRSSARRPIIRSSSAIRWSEPSPLDPCSNSLGDRSMNSCFHRDRTESLIPYSRLAWAALFCSVSISSTTRALNSGVNFRLSVMWIPFLESNSPLAGCPVFGVHYTPFLRLSIALPDLSQLTAETGK